MGERTAVTIEVKSELEVGTTFRLTIPFEIDNDYKQEKEPKHTVSVEQLSGTKVLLAEDNELNLEIAKFILEESKIDVTVAKNGKEALDIFAEDKQKTRAAGMNEHLSKPLDAQELLEMIQKYKIQIK